MHKNYRNPLSLQQPFGTRNVHQNYRNLLAPQQPIDTRKVHQNYRNPLAPQYLFNTIDNNYSNLYGQLATPPAPLFSVSSIYRS